MSKKNVLVMCTGNSFRSHMAESFIRKFAKDAADVYSAGVKASGTVSPWAIKLMAEEGIDISGHTSDQVDRFLDMQFDYVITVCDNAKETCPVFPKPVGKILHRSFRDYDDQGDLSDEEFLASLRPIRDGIKAYCRDFAENELGVDVREK
ncbi:MAG: arsenate reductase ArsC [Fibrobacterota bacterium]